MSQESGNWYRNQEKGRKKTDNEYQLHVERTSRMDPYQYPSNTSNRENTTPIALFERIAREEKETFDGKEENNHVSRKGSDVSDSDE